MSTPFTSLRHPFSIDASRGRLARENDFNQHIRQLVMQLLMTSPGERINRPDFGCGVRRLLFAPGGEDDYPSVPDQMALQRHHRLRGVGHAGGEQP